MLHSRPSPTLVGLLAPLIAAPSLYAAEALHLTLEPNTAAIGMNLVPNPSFEEVTDGQPTGWRFSKRNADAAFALVEDTRSGKAAVRFTGGTVDSPPLDPAPSCP